MKPYTYLLLCLFFIPKVLYPSTEKNPLKRLQTINFQLMEKNEKIVEKLKALKIMLLEEAPFKLQKIERLPVRNNCKAFANAYELLYDLLHDEEPFYKKVRADGWNKEMLLSIDSAIAEFVTTKFFQNEIKDIDSMEKLMPAYLTIYTNGLNSSLTKEKRTRQKSETAFNISFEKLFRPKIIRTTSLLPPTPHPIEQVTTPLPPKDIPLHKFEIKKLLFLIPPLCIYSLYKKKKKTSIQKPEKAKQKSIIL